MREADKDARAVTELAQVGWAQGLVQKVRKDRAVPGERFELRFALELHLQGLTPVRPFRTGVDNTDVDFRIPGNVPWNIELLSLNESDVIRNARSVVDWGGGIAFESLSLRSRPDLSEVAGAQPTEEDDMLRTISKLGEKVWDARNRRPIKFPVRDTSTVNMLLVDMRSYLGGDGSIDVSDCRQILYGPQGVRDAPVAWDRRSKRPLRAIWDPANEADAAAAARERIDLVGFVHEGEFVDDEIRQVTRIFRNPDSDVEIATELCGWHALSSGTDGPRTRNPLWRSG